MRTSRGSTAQTQTRSQSLARLSNAEAIAKLLGGYRAGAGWVAHCPALDDRTPSLSLRDFTSGMRRHAGCEQEHVIAALRARDLWRDYSSNWFSPSAHRSVKRGDGSKHTEAASATWQSSSSVRGTLVPGNDEYNVIASENGVQR